MKTILFLTLATAAFAADSPKVKQPAAKSAPAKSVALPADAVKIDDATYRWTDPQGKSWIFHRSPFGWAKLDQVSAAAPAANAKASEITAIDDGDTVRFERKGPFGAYKWTRKKSELTPDEKRALDSARAKKK